MTKKTRRIALSLPVIVFVVCFAAMIWRLLEYRHGSQVYNEAAQLAQLPELSAIASTQSSAPEQTEDTQAEPPAFPVGEPEAAPTGGSAGAVQLQEEAQPQEAEAVWVDPYAQALRSMDFTALRQVNEDVLGWIIVPDTGISYPLLQGDDNKYYLNHTWRGGRNSVGAIFADYRNSRDLSDFHTVIYGHRMNNNSMFGLLHRYKDLDYLQAHPYIYINDDYGSRVYEIFAVYEATAGNTYQLEFADDAEKQRFINYCLFKSDVNTGVVPTIRDRIVTLSTCTGNGHSARWVVQAVQISNTTSTDAQA